MLLWIGVIDLSVSGVDMSSAPGGTLLGEAVGGGGYVRGGAVLRAVGVGLASALRALAGAVLASW